jgi:hypothetical protein
MGTTTIEVTDEQKGRLDDHKRHDTEPYKSVVGRLLDGDDTAEELRQTPNPDALAEDVADLLVTELGDGMTLDGAGDINGSLSTIEERTGRIERLLEDLQR